MINCPELVYLNVLTLNDYLYLQSKLKFKLNSSSLSNNKNVPLLFVIRKYKYSEHNNAS